MYKRQGSGSPLITRSVDYAANVLYILSFMSCGDGGTEAARLLGLLGLPNKTTMGPKSFPVVESYISPVIQELANDIVYKRNLAEEVRLTLRDEALFDLWVQGNLHQDSFRYLHFCIINRALSSTC